MNVKKLAPLAAFALLLGAGQAALAADSASQPQGSASVGAAIDDSTITAKVKATLLDDNRLKQSNIMVKTNNGVVTLSGSADSDDNKVAAEDIAKHVDGVKDVDNQITTPSTGSTLGQDAKKAMKKTEQVSSDSWITTKVKSALLADSLTKGFKISVTTVHHVVTLSGTVDSQDTVDKATNIAEQIKGVKRVDNSALKVGNS